MQSKNVLNCVDRLLKNLLGSTNDRGVHECHPQPFGGKLFIFGGDFRQNTPVVPKQNRAGIVSQLISKSYWWDSTVKMHLSINERILRQPASTEENESFSKFLMDVGNGTIPYIPELGTHTIRIPEEYVFESPDLSSFVDWCFPNLERNADIIGDKAILTPLNKDAHILNDIALHKMNGNEVIFKSIDSVLCEDSSNEVVNYPVEYLNTLSLSGFPEHILKLKIGCPLILL
jgi:hypothetical protein